MKAGDGPDATAMPTSHRLLAVGVRIALPFAYITLNEDVALQD